jgi:predicted nucleotidyltransferase component of viral defense system
MTESVNAVFLQELAQELGVDPGYLEKDWVLTEIIRTLTSSDIGEQLVLKGGQALRHVYGSLRLSKDVDYVARKRIEFAELHDSVLGIRYPRLTLPDQPEGRTKHGFRIRPITYRSPLGRRDNRVEVEVSFRGDLLLAPEQATYVSPYCDPFKVLVMNLNEMVTEKIRAMYQRGNPRDLYDLWYIFTQLEAHVDREWIARILPEKFRPPLVAGGWDRGRLYERLHDESATWAATLHAYLPQPPAFDDALLVVERALRFLPSK